MSFIGDLIGGLFGGGSSGGSSPFHPYSPTGLSSADQSWQNLFGQYMNQMTGPNSPGQMVMNTLLPAQQGINDIFAQYGPASLNAAQNAGGYLGNMASQADQFHNLMVDQAAQDINLEGAVTGAGQNVYNMAADPQNALYNRTLNQVQQQQRAADTASGTAFSPYGAGLEGQATSNFNIDWQNNQLQRGLAGLTGMTGADKLAGQLGDAYSQQLVGAQQMSALAPQLMIEGSMAPLTQAENLFNLGNQQANTFLNTANQATAPWLQSLNQIIPYLNYGQGAQANAFGAGQSNISNIGSALGALTNEFGQGAGSGYGILGSLFSNPFGSAAASAAPLGASGFGDFAAGAGGGLGGLSEADIAAMFGL